MSPLTLPSSPYLLNLSWLLLNQSPSFGFAPSTTQVVLFVAEFSFHGHGLPKPRFCRTLVASWDKLALGGKSFKLNNLTKPRSISSCAQKRIQLGLGWPNTQRCASRGSQRTRRHFIAQAKTTCREFNPLFSKTQDLDNRSRSKCFRPCTTTSPRTFGASG